MALDADLALKLRPEKEHGYSILLRDLFALVAFVVGEEDETLGICPFQQHNPRSRSSGGLDCAQREGVGLANVGLGCFIEPAAKKRDRILSGLRLEQFSAAVVAPALREIQSPARTH